MLHSNDLKVEAKLEYQVQGLGGEERPWAPATMAVHGGTPAVEGTPGVVPVAPAIYQTASFRLPSLAEAERAYGRDGLGDTYTYSRYGNPTCAGLERAVAALEGGSSAVAVASGMAAVALSVLTLVEAGDNLVASADLYGGTRTLFAHTLRRMGIEVRFTDSADPDDFVARTDARTRAWYAETLPNPSLRVFPIAEVAAAGRALGVPLIMDNTSAPVIARPLQAGASVVVHSATKWLGGHGNAMGGVVVDGGFPWAEHPERFPALCAPDPSYHGIVWTELTARAMESAAADGNARTVPGAFAVRLRRTLLRDLGPALSPTSAALLLQGLQTLPLRLARQCATAEHITQWLTGQPQVASVNYPSLHSGRAADHRDALLVGGHGSLVGVELTGGATAARAFVEGLRLVSHVVNIGDVRSLATHPASTTHAQLTPTQQAAAGVSPGYVRLSFGLEAPEDLIADLAAALTAVTATAARTNDHPGDRP